MDNNISTSNPLNTSTIHTSEEIPDTVCEASTSVGTYMVLTASEEPWEDKASWEDNEPLPTAVRNGDLAEVGRLLEQETGRWILHCNRAFVLSARYGHVDILQCLITHIERKYGRISLADALSKAGESYSLEEALSEAIRKDQYAVIRYFLDCNIHKFPKVLKIAVQKGNYGMVRKLTDNLRDLNYYAKKEGVLDEATSWAILQKRLDILTWLVSKGANIGSPVLTSYSDKPINALTLACELGCTEMVTFLVRQGVDSLAAKEALFSAIVTNQPSVVRILVENGVDFHADDEDALVTASSFGRFQIVQYLVEQGADIHAQEDAALIAASQNGYSPTVEYLVEQGANIYAQNEKALEVAIWGYYTRIVKYLVKKMD